jgi:hypothetical protein
MLAETLSTRAVHFAFLFGRPRMVARAEASTLYDRICDALRLDDFTFKYTTPTQEAAPASKGFVIQLERKEGRGTFAVTIDNPNIQNPIRLLLVYTWPPSLEHVRDQLNLVASTVFDSLEGTWHKVHAEVRLRAQCGVRTPSALEYLRDDVVKLPRDWIESLGQPLTFMSVRFEAAAGRPAESSLDAPARELTIERLREDPKSLYFEFVSKWLQVPNVTAPTGTVDMASLRPIDADPGDYVQAAHDFLYTRLHELSSFGKGTS